MIYGIVKIWARLAIWIYFNKITINGKESIPKKEGFILASTHPNSFLDAILLGALLPRSVHFLARGDAFKRPFVAKILALLRMIPIYRMSEGKENLSENNLTFQQCKNILAHRGAILIFAEGICKNEWKVRPLKKGTYRIAHSVPEVRVLPCTLSYSSFSRVPKQIYIHFGASTIAEGKSAPQLNSHLYGEMQQGQLTAQEVPRPNGAKWLYALPALLSYLLQHWLYYILRRLAYSKTKGTVFFDSVLFGILMLVYPVFVLLATILVYAFTQSYMALLILPLLPMLAMCSSRYKA